MKVTTIAIDLAKNVFQVLGMDSHAKQVFNKRLNRTQLIEFMLQQPHCDVVFEACYSSHYWGCKFLGGITLNSFLPNMSPRSCEAVNMTTMTQWRFLKPALGQTFVSCQ